MIRFSFGADTKEFDSKTSGIKGKLKELSTEARGYAAEMVKIGAAAGVVAAAGFGKFIHASTQAVKEQQELITAADGAQKQLLLAAQAAQKYGNNLSEIDTNSVMNAAIAFEDATDMAMGFGKQLTANLSPAIQKVVRGFDETIESAGGMGAVADKAYSYMIDGAAFVVDAVDGIGRTFSVVSDGIIAGFASVSAGVANALSELVSLANMVPGVNLDGVIESIDEFAKTAGNVSKSAIDNISATLDKEMAGDTLRGWIADAEATADYTRNLTKEEIKLLGEKEIARQEAMKKEAEDEKKRADEYAKALASRVDALRQAGKTEIELLNEKYAEEISTIKEAYENKQIAADEAAILSQDAAIRNNEAMLEIDRQLMDSQRAMDEERDRYKKEGVSNMFGQLSTLMNSGSKKLFEIGKVAALANTAMNTADAAMAAYKWGATFGGPPGGAAAAAAAILAGGVQMQNIRKQTLGGGGSVGGGGGGGSVTENINSGAVPVQQRNITVSIAGETVSDSSRTMIRNLIGVINENVGDNVNLGVR